MTSTAARQIAQHLSPAYQPIFDLRGGLRRVAALECLTRGDPATSPDEIFRLARVKGIERELDRLCIATCLTKAPRGLRVALNVHASTLEQGREFIEFLGHAARQAGIPLQNIILEILEHRTSERLERLAETTRRLQALGVAIAVDDLGIGGSNLHMLIEVKPDIVKIDRFIIAGCDSDRRRVAILKAVGSLCRSFGCIIVAEGVETAGELEVVRNHRIRLVQGFHLARAGSPGEIEGLARTGSIVMPVGAGEMPPFGR